MIDSGERIYEQFYPSISSQALGRAVGRAMSAADYFPRGWIRTFVVMGIGLVCLPATVLCYALQKLTGSYFELTANHLKQRRLIGGQLQQSVPIQEIHEIRVEELPGQGFFRAADVVLLDSHRRVLIHMSGVAQASGLEKMVQSNLVTLKAFKSARQDLAARKLAQESAAAAPPVPAASSKAAANTVANNSAASTAASNTAINAATTQPAGDQVAAAPADSVSDGPKAAASGT